MTQVVSLNQLFSIRYNLDPAKTVVLATGVFDVLHTEHQKFLQAAKKSGDVLVVGLETDSRVRKLKGIHRPVNKLKTRLKQVADLSIADFVFSLGHTMDTQEKREEFIYKLRPHLLAASANTPYLDKKRHLMRMVGGQVKIVLSHNPHISTSQLLAPSPKQE